MSSSPSDDQQAVSPDPAELKQDLIYEDVPEDDRVIGRALRISAGLLVAIALLAAIIWWVLQRQPVVEEVQEAPAQPVQSLSAVTEIDPPQLRFTDITLSSGIQFPPYQWRLWRTLTARNHGRWCGVF